MVVGTHLIGGTQWSKRHDKSNCTHRRIVALSYSLCRLFGLCDQADDSPVARSVHPPCALFVQQFVFFSPTSRWRLPCSDTWSNQGTPWWCLFDHSLRRKKRAFPTHFSPVNGNQRRQSIHVCRTIGTVAGPSFTQGEFFGNAVMRSFNTMHVKRHSVVDFHPTNGSGGTGKSMADYLCDCCFIPDETKSVPLKLPGYSLCAINKKPLENTCIMAFFGRRGNRYAKRYASYLRVFFHVH